MLDNAPLSATDKVARSRSVLTVLSRFSLVGVLATLMYAAVANALIYSTTISPPRASLLAYLAGAVVSFFGQRSLTFNRTSDFRRHLFRYLILLVAGSTFCYLAVWFCTVQLALTASIATLLTAIAYPVLSFAIMSLWVFKS
jgi:putative flippase GtrA